VEEFVLADSREWLLVLSTRRERPLVGMGAGLRLVSTVCATLLMGLPMRLLTVFVATTDRLAASTLLERSVDGTTCSAGLSFDHFDVFEEMRERLFSYSDVSVKLLVAFCVAVCTCNKEDLEDSVIRCRCRRLRLSRGCSVDKVRTCMDSAARFRRQ
jgi:hypothetical protein